MNKNSTRGGYTYLSDAVHFFNGLIRLFIPQPLIVFPKPGSQRNFSEAVPVVICNSKPVIFTNKTGRTTGI